MKEKNEAEETRDQYFKEISDLQEVIKDLEMRHQSDIKDIDVQHQKQIEYLKKEMMDIQAENENLNSWKKKKAEIEENLEYLRESLEKEKKER